jgi:hypothetical protein
MGMTARKTLNSRRWLAGFVLATFSALALAALASDGGRNQKLTEKPLLAGSGVPTPVRAILQRACQDCHSENTTWPWYAHVPPISWEIHNDVERGRAFLDLSKWNDYSEAEQLTFSIAIGSAVQNQLMPPASYLLMHNSARLSGEDRELIRGWVLASQRNESATASPLTSTRAQRANSVHH